MLCIRFEFRDVFKECSFYDRNLIPILILLYSQHFLCLYISHSNNSKLNKNSYR